MRSPNFVFTGLALLAPVAVLTAGDLTPPAGPVAPTMKRLSEVEPRAALSQLTAPGNATNQFRITQPGSYYLTGNIAGVSGKNCITIESEGVSLDLNGFKLEGVTGSLAGIVTTHDFVTIRNGHVHNFSVGVNALESVGVRIQNIASTNHDNQAIRASVGAVLENCVTEFSDIGFDVFESASLIGCTSRYAESTGFAVARGSTLTNCTALNADIGFHLTGPAVLTNCTAQSNQVDGFRIAESAVLTDCVAFDNGSAGFYSVARSRLTRCNARDNEYGFFLTEANSVVECTASSNDSNGVYITGNANTVERSTMHENGAAGVNVATGAGNNIDGNLLTYNGTYGLIFSSGANLAVRNRARGNSTSNYLFHGSSDYGVILSNPGQAFTSTAAWANFAF